MLRPEIEQTLCLVPLSGYLRCYLMCRTSRKLAAALPRFHQTAQVNGPIAPKICSKDTQRRRGTTIEQFRKVLRRRHVVLKKIYCSPRCCCSCAHAGARVARRNISPEKQWTQIAATSP